MDLLSCPRFCLCSSQQYMFLELVWSTCACTGQLGYRPRYTLKGQDSQRKVWSGMTLSLLGLALPEEVLAETWSVPMTCVAGIGLGCGGREVKFKGLMQIFLTIALTLSPVLGTNVIRKDLGECMAQSQVPICPKEALGVWPSPWNPCRQKRLWQGGSAAQAQGSTWLEQVLAEGGDCSGPESLWQRGPCGVRFLVQDPNRLTGAWAGWGDPGHVLFTSFNLPKVPLCHHWFPYCEGVQAGRSSGPGLQQACQIPSRMGRH